MAQRPVREAAIGFLARREHSRGELRRKLQDKGYPEADIDTALDDLEAERLLSDRRFAEAYVAARIQRGFGPLRIIAELRQRQVADPLVEQCLAQAGADWEALARAARCKRFGDAPPADQRERARQARFLEGRGFTAAQIRRALEGGD